MMFSLTWFLKKQRPAWSAASLFVFGSLIPQAAHALLRIDADFVNLTDVVPGQDLWQGTYRLSLQSFATNEGFTVLFDPLLYANLSTPLLPTPPGWDVLTVQPDVALSAPGFLDGLARDNPTLSQPFNLRFVWKGTSPPSQQPFETYTLNGGFRITDTGLTTTIPEVGFGFGTGWLLAAFAAASTGRRLSRATARKAS